MGVPRLSLVYDPNRAPEDFFQLYLPCLVIVTAQVVRCQVRLTTIEILVDSCVVK